LEPDGVREDLEHRVRVQPPRTERDQDGEGHQILVLGHWFFAYVGELAAPPRRTLGTRRKNPDLLRFRPVSSVSTVVESFQRLGPRLPVIKPLRLRLPRAPPWRRR